MKILFLSPTVPYPLTDGGRIRVYNLLKQIAQGNEVTLLALETQPTDVDSISHIQQYGIAVHLVKHQHTLPRLSFSTLLTALLRRQPITVTRYNVSTYRKKLQELLTSESYDILHYEMFHTAQFHTESEIPSVLSQQNVDSAIWNRLTDETSNILYKFAYWTQKIAFQRYERVLSSKFDAVTCTSEIDAAIFEKHCPNDIVKVIPNGVDISHFAPDNESEDAAHLIYIGSMDWYPNEDAVYFFADEVLPIVRESVQNVKFSIVGGNPSEQVQRLEDRDGVVVTGRVPEIKPYFSAATVFVVPLRIGSGTRLKILEALAMGKAVVSTTVGAEGLELQDGKEIMIADDPSHFAESVIQLLTDPMLRNNIGENGRIRVEQDYDWQNIGMKLLSVYELIVNKKKFTRRSS